MVVVFYGPYSSHGWTTEQTTLQCQTEIKQIELHVISMVFVLS